MLFQYGFYYFKYIHKRIVYAYGMNVAVICNFQKKDRTHEYWLFG